VSEGASAARLPLPERFSDRLNPVLVREIQQATNGKTFLAALALALTGIAIVAITTAAEGPGSRRQGWDGFVLSLRVLAPLLFLVVPMQAFLSMRQEVSAGTLEQTLLTRLTPWGIVRGKLLASMVEGVVFFSVFAPLIALMFLLRGVDVPTIAVVLVVTLAYAVGAASFGIAMGALCRWPAFRALPLVAAAFVLAAFTFYVTGAMQEVLWGASFALREPRTAVLSSLLLAMPVVLGVPLLLLVGASALTHPHENRSTGFRIYALLALVATTAWPAALEAQSGSLFGSRGADSATPTVLALAAALWLPFWLFASTEAERLSPRVRRSVPRNPVLALLAAPFLPGGARGLLWTVLLVALACISVSWIPSWFGSVPAERAALRAPLAWAYVLIYAAAARLVRGRLGRHPRAALISRAVFPVGIGLLMLVPVLVQILTRDRTWSWSPLAPLNPFRTVVRDVPESDTLRTAIWVVACLAVVVNLPAIVRSLAEVLAASRERRAGGR
jgi:hypothetical protein